MNTFNEYKAVNAISATAIKAGRISMLHMWHVMNGGNKEATAAMLKGSLLHAAILEPDRLSNMVRVWDGSTKRGKEWESFKADCPSDCFIVSREELDEVNAIVAAVHANNDAHEIIAETRHEVSCFWTDNELGKCKCRFDGVGESVGVLELKTARQIERRTIGNQFVNMGYDIQCGWYLDGALRTRQTTCKRVSMLYVETVPPYDVALWRVPTRALNKGLEYAREIAAEYRDCERNECFPGVQVGDELELPTWYEGDVNLDDIIPMDGE